jgi:nicotinate-nucleotide adenylyltransferase
VRLARLARARLGLETVLLAPAGIQPLKADEVPGASWAQRLRMVELAIAGEVGLAASDVDAPRGDGRPNYSAETVARLREMLERETPDEISEIYFLLGADAFASLRRWHEPELLLQQVELVVANRPGYLLPQEGKALLEYLPEGARFLGKEEMAAATGDGSRTAEAFVFLAGRALVRVYLLEEMAEDIAASELRAQLASPDPSVRGNGFAWLPDRVAAYVRAEGLYGAA